MSFANKYNTSERKFKFDTPNHFEYYSLKELVKEYGIDKIHKVNAIYINTKSRFGDAPVIVTDSELVNAPHHLLDTVKQVLNDGESISLINNGYVGFKVYEYETKEFGTNYSLEWVDIND